MWIEHAILSNFINLILIEHKFYEAELKLIDIRTTTCFTPPKEENFFSVLREVKDLVDLSAFNVFNHSFLRVRHYEKAAARKDVVYFIHIPKSDNSEFFTALASSWSQIVRFANFYICIELVLYSKKWIRCSQATRFVVELFYILTKLCLGFLFG